MQDSERIVFRELNNIVKSARDISKVEPALGDFISFFINQAMKAYESMVRQEEFNVRDIIQFIGRAAGKSEKELLSISYPKTTIAKSADNDPISSAIHADNIDRLDYEKNAEALIKELRTEVHESIGTTDG